MPTNLRAAATLLLCLGPWLQAQSAVCTAPQSPRCAVIEQRGIVIGKTILDPLAVADQALSQPFDNGAGSLGQLDSAVVQGLVMYRVSVDPSAAAPVAAFALQRAVGSQPVLALLDNAVGGQAPDWLLWDTEATTDLSFAFANGLAPGQASRWIVDTAGGAAFEPLGLGSVVGLLGAASAPKPLLAPVPEPGSAMLLAGGLLALCRRLRRG